MPASTNDKRGLDRSLLVTEQTIEPGFGAVDMFDDCSGKALTEVGPVCHGPGRSQ